MIAWKASIITYEKFRERFTGKHHYAAVFFNSQNSISALRTSRKWHDTATEALDYARRFNLRNEKSISSTEMA